MIKNILNKAQKEAIEYTEGPLLIVAGAGTGKTTVITKKITYLIEQGLAKPEEILALTFTDKAAQEMEERVDSLLSLGYRDLHISTFHSFCQQLLEDKGLSIGIPDKFSLLSQMDAWMLVKKHLYDFELDYYRPLGSPSRHIHALLDHFSKCKDELISPEAYLEYAKDCELNKDNLHNDEKSRIIEIANAYHKYNQLLLDNESLDFGDLINYSVLLLQKREAIKEQLQKRFKYILVDEFQDVNWAQYKLVKLLSEKSQLTVVGDDDQSIYAFRGASVSNIMRFPSDFKNPKQVVLTKNYRSGQNILDAAYNGIQNNNPYRLEEKLKINKKLESALETKGHVEHLHSFTLQSEVYSVIQTIATLKEKDTSLLWSDFAILVRANNHAEPFLQALDKEQIPYDFLAAQGLFRQPIVLDAINFFRLLDSYKESSAIYRLLRIPCISFSQNDLHKLTAFAKKKSISYYAALKRPSEAYISPEGATMCSTLLSWIHSGIKDAVKEKPTVVLYNFLESSGYLAYIAQKEQEGDSDVIKGIIHLTQFFDLLEDFENSNPDTDVRLFMKHYEELMQAGDSGSLHQIKDTPDSVQILTIHASKGLEFKNVFVVNVVEDRFPSRRRGGAIEIPEELINESLPDGDAHYQEERRLFYVALTRAKNNLYITSADNYGGVRKKKISRFIPELLLDKESELEKKEITKKKISFVKPKNQEKEKKQMDFTPPKAFSFSQIKSYQTCPYQYKLSHILKIPRKGSAAFSFGSSIHNTMQAFYEKVQELNSVSQGSLFEVIPQTENKVLHKIKVPEKKILLEMYEDNWISDWYESEQQRNDYYEKGKAILKTFYDSQEGSWNVPVSLEGWFKVQIGDYLLHGRIDRIDQVEDGSLEIIDYKTGKSKEKLTTDDKDQLLIYQIAAQTLPQYRNIGKTSKLTFYYVNDNIKTSFLGNEKDLERITNKVSKTISEITSGNFTATPGVHVCKYCDFKNICEYST